uniref:Uncharacterized protein n=1 Tax=Rhizophora mucronata TaxID=61149 RepID=A0A2P2KRL0_RHIMU
MWLLVTIDIDYYSI